jgi:uncharacterized YigZ family protein
MQCEYPIPAKVHRVREKIKQSRFIATLAPVPTIERARKRIKAIQSEFADATHHCWGYVVGPPGSTAAVGLSDDREPHGTAGRPILNVLLHSGIGDILAVVTRYYGGAKLGTGGLVRAYSGMVKNGLLSLPVVNKVSTTRLTIVVDYGHAESLRKVARSFNAGVVREEYRADVTVDLDVAEKKVEELISAVGRLTGGAAVIQKK